MSNTVESLFTAALGPQSPWVVEQVALNTAKRRIDFEVGLHSHTPYLSGLRCGRTRHP